MPEVEKATCLVLIIDIGLLLANHKQSLSGLIDDILFFRNSFEVMHRNNRILILLSSGSSKSVDLDSNALLLLSKLHSKSTNPCIEAKSLSRCLSAALCIVNNRHNESYHFRILVLQFDRDVPVNYNGVMNSIFR